MKFESTVERSRRFDFRFMELRHSLVDFRKIGQLLGSSYEIDGTIKFNSEIMKEALPHHIKRGGESSRALYCQSIKLTPHMLLVLIPFEMRRCMLHALATYTRKAVFSFYGIIA